MKFIERLIIWLIRVRLGVGKWDEFYFPNQKHQDDRYYFNNTCLMMYVADTNTVRKANVSLNYLLSRECVVKIDEDFDWDEKILEKIL